MLISVYASILFSLHRFRQSILRPNIKYSVIEKPTQTIPTELKDYVMERHRYDSGIIYCLSRKDCDLYCERLNHHGIKACVYYSTLDQYQKDDNQIAWMSNKVSPI